jgi:hypothetical protein
MAFGWGNLENIHFRDLYGDREGNCTIDLARVDVED